MEQHEHDGISRHRHQLPSLIPLATPRLVQHLTAHAVVHGDVLQTTGLQCRPAPEARRDARPRTRPNYSLFTFHFSIHPLAPSRKEHDRLDYGHHKGGRCSLAEREPHRDKQPWHRGEYAVYGIRFTVYSLQIAVHGLQITVHGLQIAVHGLLFLTVISIKTRIRNQA